MRRGVNEERSEDGISLEAPVQNFVKSDEM